MSYFLWMSNSTSSSWSAFDVEGRVLPLIKHWYIMYDVMQYIHSYIQHLLHGWIERILRLWPGWMKNVEVWPSAFLLRFYVHTAFQVSSMDVDEQNCVLVWNMEYHNSITKKAAKLQNIKLMGVQLVSTSTTLEVWIGEFVRCKYCMRVSFLMNLQ
jgi:hypothetical protein